MLTRRTFLRQTAVAAAGLFAGGHTARAWAPGNHTFGQQFLLKNQSPDGAWRSQQYAALRDGDALTPLVLWAMPSPTENEEIRAKLDQGWHWLDRLTEQQTAKAEPWAGLSYPLFTASYAAQAYAAKGNLENSKAWARVVEKLRIEPALDWPKDSPACGAWGDAASPPRWPAGLPAPPDMLAPNLSATLLGMQALQAARLPGAERALPFVRACQNFAAEAPGPFDDGGFFFTPGDRVRNKAGVAGRDASGRERYRSYGSTTCDGVLAAAVAGVPSDAASQQAALRWIQARAEVSIPDPNPTLAPKNTEDSLRFYHAQALAGVLELARTIPALSDWARTCTYPFTLRLTYWQSMQNGSWRNEVPDNFEDDPLVATAFAVRALSRAFGEKS